MPRDHFYCLCNLKYLINQHSHAFLTLRAFNCFLICLLSKKRTESQNCDFFISKHSHQIFENLPRLYFGDFFLIFRAAKTAFMKTAFLWALWMKDWNSRNKTRLSDTHTKVSKPWEAVKETHTWSVNFMNESDEKSELRFCSLTSLRIKLASEVQQLLRIYEWISPLNNAVINQSSDC